MPRIKLSARTRRLNAQLGAAGHHGYSPDEIEELRLEFRRSKAEDLRAVAERELAEIEALVSRTRREQGLPPKVTDPSTLARVADMLRLPDGGGPDAA